MTDRAPTLDALRLASSRAERLEERIERLRREGADLPDPESDALAPWARSFASGAGDRLAALERRLAWDRISPSLAAAAIAETAERLETPSWLRSALGWSVVGADLSAASGSPSLEGVPFPELWRPWALAAGVRLAQRDSAYEALPVRSRERLIAFLGVEIGRLSERAAYAQFERARAERPLGTGAYRAFVAEQRSHGLLPLYVEFPALLRQTARRAEQFVESWSELFERWRKDRAALTSAYGASAEEIVEVEPLDSDRHAGGRRVARLSFASGLSLVYKPRSLAPESRFSELCDLLRERGFEDAPPAARVLERDSYGWMAWIERSDPPGEEDLDAWFRRAGALVALSDLLGAEDLHGENLVSTAEGPVPVDLELLLRPARSARDLERGSAIDSGLLARRSELARGERVARWAGLATGRPVVPGAARAWAALGFDDLHPVPSPARPNVLKNLPRAGGREVGSEERLPALLAGYRAAYRALLEARDELRAPGGFFDRLRGVPTRILFRPSQDYATLLDRMAAAPALRDSIAASLLHEASLRPFASSIETPRLWPLVAAERAALAELDVPRFEAISDRDALPLPGGGELAGVLQASGLERARRRFALWSEADLTAQAAEIERESSAAPRLDVVAGEPDANQTASERYAAVARSLIEAIAARRLELGIEADAAPDEDLSRRVRRASLYDGLAGEALLLSFGAELPGVSESVAEAATIARRGFEEGVDALLGEADLPLGAMQGIGSWLWTEAWLDRRADERSTLSRVDRTVALLSPERLATDRSLDVEGGLAGLILGLLAAADRWPASGALAKACEAGLLLVERAEKTSAGGLGWRGEAGRPLAGFAHGASGAARALSALAAATSDERFVEATHGALAFERSLFDPMRKNWPVLLAPDASGEPRATWMTAWCHGAAGIGLARLFIAASLGEDSGPGGEPQLRSELETAMATTASAGAAPRDHLCCGSGGRASILALASESAGAETWRRAAESIADAVLDRARTTGSFELPRGNDPLAAADWGMMRGRAGVAWLLLELARSLPRGLAQGSGNLPCLLALEAPGELERRRS